MDAGGGSTTKPDDNEEESPYKRKLNVCITVVGAIVGFVMLIVSILAFVSLRGFVNDYNSVVDSWRDLPITSVSFVNSGGSCPSGAELVQSYWPGLYPACDCSHQTGNSTTNPVAACTSQQLRDLCTDLPTLYPAATPLDVIPGWKMCITRGGVNALSRTQNPNGNGSGAVIRSVCPLC
jgi:hypothetical protein